MMGVKNLVVKKHTSRNQDSGKHHGAEAGQVKLGVQVYGPKTLGGNEGRSQGGRHLSQTRLCLYFATLSRPAPWGLFPGRSCTASTDPPEHHPPSNEPWIPEYFEKFNEPIEDKQSKRGMLENGLLLGNLLLTPFQNLCHDFYSGSFAKKEMDEEKLGYYDRLINLPSNDCEIYAWAVGQKDTPTLIVMDMLKQHAKNENIESRIVLPELIFPDGLI
jgi:succinate dehydrogenase assembly factor 2